MAFKPEPMQDQTEFNSAFAYLEKVTKIEYFVEEFLANWEVRKAYDWLESYENELAFCFKEEDISKIKKLKQEICKIFNEHPSIGRKGKDANHRDYRMDAEEERIVRDKVIELNQCLRQIKFKNGMTMPKKGEGRLF